MGEGGRWVWVDGGAPSELATLGGLEQLPRVHEGALGRIGAEQLLDLVWLELRDDVTYLGHARELRGGGAR